MVVNNNNICRCPGSGRRTCMCWPAAATPSRGTGASPPSTQTCLTHGAFRSSKLKCICLLCAHWNLRKGDMKGGGWPFPLSTKTCPTQGVFKSSRVKFIWFGCTRYNLTKWGQEGVDGPSAPSTQTCPTYVIPSNAFFRSKLAKREIFNQLIIAKTQILVCLT